MSSRMGPIYRHSHPFMSSRWHIRQHAFFIQFSAFKKYPGNLFYYRLIFFLIIFISFPILFKTRICEKKIRNKLRQLKKRRNKEVYPLHPPPPQMIHPAYHHHHIHHHQIMHQQMPYYQEDKKIGKSESREVPREYNKLTQGET